LYKGIEQSEGFAGELDMNGLGMQMVKLSLLIKKQTRQKEAVKVKDAVSAHVGEYRANLPKNSTNLQIRSLLDDLEELGSSLEGDMLKKGDMPTFLDAYLFRMAAKKENGSVGWKI
jgi:hypothetical protein